MVLYAIEGGHSIIGKLQNKNEGPQENYQLQERRTLWLIEVLHAIKRDGSLESSMQKIKVLTENM